jgi:hypothetical protein
MVESRPSTLSSTEPSDHVCDKVSLQLAILYWYLTVVS